MAAGRGAVVPAAKSMRGTAVRIYGVDFSSSPASKRPMVYAVCRLEGCALSVEGIEAGITGLADFAEFLQRPGPWTAGLDLPFGLPCEVVRAFGWPSDWADYVAEASKLSDEQFAARVSSFQQSRPLGCRHAYRETDRLAGALPPTNLRGVPTARMFHRGSPLLLESGVSVVPCLPRPSERTVVEAYPKLVVHALVGKGVRYKSACGEAARRHAADARRRILKAAVGPRLRLAYGIHLSMCPEVFERCAQDHSGDTLDAVLCAVQAAWSMRQRAPRYGVPPTCNANEGWIVDPAGLVEA
ncbi:MAG: DUF429 domain-containing protein [Armatimonadota bacterium]